MSRTTIKVPGFTAEASLFTSSENYRSNARYTYHARKKMVVPQMRQTCFQMCKAAGNSDDACHRACDIYDPPVISRELFVTRQVDPGGAGGAVGEGGEGESNSCPGCHCPPGMRCSSKAGLCHCY